MPKRYRNFLSTLNGILTILVDKAKTVVDDDDNDVYETIEFSDSSSNIYTEPVRDYGVLRKVNIKTTTRKPPSGLKKSTGTKNLQKFTAVEDISKVDDEPSVELRVKPFKPMPSSLKRDSSKPTTVSLISVGLSST